jgi:voltage-gated potassium channel
MKNSHAGTPVKWREELYRIIFESDTPAGKRFDEVLILSIVLSVVAVMMDSVRSVNVRYGDYLYAAEWFFTILFSVEYGLRIFSAPRRLSYITSFFGLVDLFAILPTYLSLLFPGSQYLIVIRMLRVLRIFRILKLVEYIGEAGLLLQALKASMRKIVIFFTAVLSLVVIFGSVIYLIEGEANGFTSIPTSIYWAIVTMTTVGYGDISPGTPVGQFFASVIMIMGYSIIAVPTGIVTVEMSDVFGRRRSGIICSGCTSENHEKDAIYCKYCGTRIPGK